MTREEIVTALRQAVPAGAEYGTVKVPSRLELIRRIAQYLATKPPRLESRLGYRLGREEY